MNNITIGCYKMNVYRYEGKYLTKKFLLFYINSIHKV